MKLNDKNIHEAIEQLTMLVKELGKRLEQIEQLLSAQSINTVDIKPKTNNNFLDNYKRYVR